jgi:hypothetical protein
MTTTKLSYSDQLFLMNTAIIECSIHENISKDSIYIFFSKKSGYWYILSKEKNVNGKPLKVWFKKHKDTF